jgi:uncharacterized protein (TIGR03382 family)
LIVPRRLSVFFNGGPRISDKLFIDFWGASINADGGIAIGAAVIIVLALLRWRRR